ncbi:hypothetical protein FGU71_07160 [Erythrobacter insulae]|uniref:Nodulation protein Z n=1 Tax=Erythrobacter insulae TaxID=2584124 RepID=A0A547PC13_9SPHN|nr:nodulation protein NodZ [Erythrobacter insulae]TRD11667.1 hypothetical protein FGU71_07160 [Erythrobacter insulae]
MTGNADIEGHPTKALAIKAKGGLGNRMLSAITGLVLARLNNRTAYIDWRDGMYVPAGENLYPMLFDADWMGDVGQLDDCTDVWPAVWSGRMALHPTDVIHREYPAHHKNPFIYRKLSIDLLRPDPPQDVAVFWSYLPKLERIRRRIATHPDFAGRSSAQITREMLDRFFVPRPEITGAVDQLFLNLDGPTIGVHIRFTDRKVPLHKIVKRIGALKDALPAANIFLATDSKEAQDTILDRFPHTLSIQKTLADNDAALHVASNKFTDPLGEARNAVIDMMALARCDCLIHSSHSTFSCTAALAGRIPRSRQIDVDRFNPKVAIKHFLQART